MNWNTVLSALLGAAIGVGSTITLEQIRWHREGSERWRQTRRATYVEFLTALSAAHSGLISAVLKVRADDDYVYGRLHEAVHDSKIWQRRQALALTAPQSVLRQAVRATGWVERLRDPLIAAPDIESPGYIKARDSLWSVNAALRETMREDLEMSGPPDPDVERFGLKL